MKKQNILVWVAVIVVVAGMASSVLLRGKGFIRIETPGVNLRLRSGWIGTTTVYSASGPVEVRAGIYHPVQAIIALKKDTADEGRSWTLFSRGGPWGKLASIRVDKGQTVNLRLGPPITLHTDVQRNGRTVSVGLSLIGQAGEYWSPQVMTSQGQAPAPTVQIVDETEKVLASGRFAYG
jgi:hypothetical protein